MSIEYPRCCAEECWYVNNPDRLNEYGSSYDVAHQCGLVEGEIRVYCDVCVRNNVVADYECMVCERLVVGDSLRCGDSTRCICGVCVEEAQYLPCDVVRENYEVYATLVHKALCAEPGMEGDMCWGGEFEKTGLPSKVSYSEAAKTLGRDALFVHAALDLDGWTNLGDDQQFEQNRWLRDLFQRHLTDIMAAEVQTRVEKKKQTELGNKRKRTRQAYTYLKEHVPHLELEHFEKLAADHKRLRSRSTPFGSAADAIKWLVRG